MADKAPNLYDAYIIDGIPQALTPAGLLQECTLPGALPSVQPACSVADLPFRVIFTTGAGFRAAPVKV